MKVYRSLRTALLAMVFLAAPPAIAQTGERFLIAQSDAQQTPDAQGDVLDVAAASGQFTRFLAAVEAAGYEETLRGEGPFTIFAPTDDAFRQMDQRELDRLMQPRNREELLAILAYHVVPERVTTASVDGAQRPMEASSGYRVQIDGRDGLRVNDQLVVMPDIEASNGVIQGINTVMSPPVLVASNSESGR